MAPDFQLQMRDGSTFTLSKQRGKVVFLNFWATWCTPCRIEMPAMEALYQEMKQKEFSMVAVSVDELGWPIIDEFVAKLQLTLPIVLDEDQKVAKKYNAFRYPETFIIDQTGKIVDKRTGPAHWSDPRFVKYFNDLLVPVHH